MTRFHVLLAVALAAMGCDRQLHTSPGADARVERLHAFARLYGVVRWFHPSDAAADVDWAQFAEEGAAASIEARDGAFETTLQRLFAPIAPSVVIYRKGNTRPPIEQLAMAAGGVEHVAWQHLGYGDTGVATGYKSKRRHRARQLPVTGTTFAALWQAVDGQPLQGKRIRLRAMFRGAQSGCGRLWVRVERPGGVGFFDNMGTHPAQSSQWASGQIEGTVDSDAQRVVVGILKENASTCWYDDLHFEREDGSSWKSIELANPGFEDENTFLAWKPGIGRPPTDSLDGWSVELDHEAIEGRVALRIRQKTTTVTEELFDDAPRIDEAVELELGIGLKAHVPLSLPSRNGATLDGSRPAPPPRRPSAPHDEIATQAADVIILWNVIQHFWPYWDTLPFEWMTQLDRGLELALRDRGVDQHRSSLRLMMAQVPDGHISLTCPNQTPLATAAVAVDEVEGKLLVLATTIAELRLGDELISIDGVDAMKRRNDMLSVLAGSLQYRKVQAHKALTEGPLDSRAKLRIRRAGQLVDIEATRQGNGGMPRRAPLEHLAGDVYYVDLARTTRADLEPIMPQLAAATGVVFDMRERPRDGEFVLSHLLTRPTSNETWAAYPHIIRPDHVHDAIPTWAKEGWNLPALSPRIAGRVAFVSGPNAVSYPETLLGYIAGYKLGEIVGRTSAGTNGDIASVEGPSGCQTWFTGLKITKLDGSPTLMTGFAPTLPVARTAAGVAAGRDEELERALEYVRTGH